MSDKNKQSERGTSKCPENRDLVGAVVVKLRDIAWTSNSQAEARQKGDEKLAAELDEQLGRLQREKEQSINTWRKHVREHGC